MQVQKVAGQADLGELPPAIPNKGDPSGVTGQQQQARGLTPLLAHDRFPGARLETLDGQSKNGPPLSRRQIVTTFELLDENVQH